jgi:hypothetical protein
MIPEHSALCDVFGGEHLPPTDPAARLLLPFTERAWGHPDAERIMRDGLAFLAEFCDGGRVEPADEPTMLRSAARFLDRNYPTAVAA